MSQRVHTIPHYVLLLPLLCTHVCVHVKGEKFICPSLLSISSPSSSSSPSCTAQRKLLCHSSPPLLRALLPLFLSCTCTCMCKGVEKEIPLLSFLFFASLFSRHHFLLPSFLPLFSSSPLATPPTCGALSSFSSFLSSLPYLFSFFLSPMGRKNSIVRSL